MLISLYPVIILLGKVYKEIKKYSKFFYQDVMAVLSIIKFVNNSTNLGND